MQKSEVIFWGLVIGAAVLAVEWWMNGGSLAAIAPYDTSAAETTSNQLATGTIDGINVGSGGSIASLVSPLASESFPLNLSF